MELCYNSEADSNLNFQLFFLFVFNMMQVDYKYPNREIEFYLCKACPNFKIKTMHELCISEG